MSEKARILAPYGIFKCSLAPDPFLYCTSHMIMQGTLTETWKEVHPTVVFAVPRVWEKIQEKLVSLGRQSSNMKRKIGAWAKAKGLRGMEARNKG